MTGLAVYPLDSECDKSQFLAQHTPLLKRIAYHLISRLPPEVQIEDLIQAGVVGLLEAARHYDPEQGASFATYAGIRIRGAMLDELRRLDWKPRSVHRNTRKFSDAVREIERREQRPARDWEVAQELNLEIDEYHRLLRDVAGYRVVSMDEVFSLGEENQRTGTGPFEQVQKSAFKGSLARTIEELPEREKLVIVLYYDEELNLREIGEVLGVSESRVCQIHGQALIRLRARMKEWLSGDLPFPRAW
jgi:RNA polymerase sigma factor for flagellar operon FliA